MAEAEAGIRSSCQLRISQASWLCLCTWLFGKGFWTVAEGTRPAFSFLSRLIRWKMIMQSSEGKSQDEAWRGHGSSELQ